MELFRKRMANKGTSSHSRAMYLKQRSFEQWFNGALNKYEVIIDGIKQTAVIQDHNQNNNDNLSDDKYMIIKNESNVRVGSYIEWENETWLTFGYENKTIKTHKQTKIKQTNEVFKWINKNGEICNNGKGYRAHVKNQTLYTLGVNTSGNNLWIANAQMMMYLPNNDEVSELTLGDRLFIGRNVYQIMFNDDVSRIGLSNFLLEQDMLNEEIDNVELRIADYYKNIKDDEDEDIDQDTVVIEGNDKARVGRTEVYTATSSNGDKIHKWSVIDVDESVNISNQDEDSITISVKNDFRKVGSQITIVGSTKDGVVGSKKVNIISPY